MMAIMAVVIDTVMGGPRGLFNFSGGLSYFISAVSKGIYNSDDRNAVSLLKGMFLLFMVAYLAYFAAGALIGAARSLSGEYLYWAVQAILLAMAVSPRKVAESALRGRSSTKGIYSNTEHRELGARADSVGYVAEKAVAEVATPLFLFFIGGVQASVVARVFSAGKDLLIDSERRMYYGKAFDIADKIASYIPARIVAFLVVLSSLPLGYDWRGSFARIREWADMGIGANYRWTKAAMSGALDRFSDRDYGINRDSVRLMYGSIVLSLAIQYAIGFI